MGLDPENCGYVALMSGVYAAAGRWEAAGRVREVFDCGRLVKDAGFIRVDSLSPASIHPYPGEPVAFSLSSTVFRQLGSSPESTAGLLRLIRSISLQIVGSCRFIDHECKHPKEEELEGLRMPCPTEFFSFHLRSSRSDPCPQYEKTPDEGTH
ncbi:hypothetical protein QJS10_CPA09g01922 [Acorus calamus]|uniref:Uncharacterized protein n=1 Tax=Acorus calamus TaxID=4465 RepID=A0AAV9E5R7_ACOCL|nr:hypothetical protein QJS10_CPA09g01922 [Acorus calamus]